VFSFEQTNFYIDFIFQGLRAFLPKFELMDRINTFTDLKNKVGCSIRVCITRLDEETNDLIISEKKAWVSALAYYLYVLFVTVQI
jgi:ribosomal protein S1